MTQIEHINYISHRMFKIVKHQKCVCLCFGGINKLTQNAFNYLDAYEEHEIILIAIIVVVVVVVDDDVCASIHISNVCCVHRKFEWIVSLVARATVLFASSFFFFCCFHFFVVAAYSVFLFIFSYTSIRSIEEYVWFHNALKLYVKLCKQTHDQRNERSNKQQKKKTHKNQTEQPTICVKCKSLQCLPCKLPLSVLFYRNDEQQQQLHTKNYCEYFPCPGLIRLLKCMFVFDIFFCGFICAPPLTHPFPIDLCGRHRRCCRCRCLMFIKNEVHKLAASFQFFAVAH